MMNRQKRRLKNQASQSGAHSRSLARLANKLSLQRFATNMQDSWLKITLIGRLKKPVRLSKHVPCVERTTF